MTPSATERDAHTLRRQLATLDQQRITAATQNGVYTGGLHLAVMTGPFLDLICAGAKTVESRFHRQRRSPLFVARSEDVVVFRQSGKSATLAAVLSDALYLDLEEHPLAAVRRTWASRIGCDDDDFWQARADARWVSLLTLDTVLPIPPTVLHKRDRQGWVTYPTVADGYARQDRVDAPL